MVHNELPNCQQTIWQCANQIATNTIMSLALTVQHLTYQRSCKSLWAFPTTKALEIKH